MSKKGIIIAAVVVLLVGVLVIVQLMQKPNVDLTNATVFNISEGRYHIACDDAKWLLDKNIAMVQEKLAQLESIEKPGEDLTEEEYQQMQDAVYNLQTLSQLDIHEWYDAVVLGIVGLESDANKQDEIHDTIANEYVQIYQTAMAIHLGLMDEDEVRAEIEVTFCE